MWHLSCSSPRRSTHVHTCTARRAKQPPPRAIGPWRQPVRPDRGSHRFQRRPPAALLKSVRLDRHKHPPRCVQRTSAGAPGHDGPPSRPGSRVLRSTGRRPRPRSPTGRCVLRAARKYSSCAPRVPARRCPAARSPKRPRTRSPTRLAQRPKMLGFACSPPPHQANISLR